MSKEIASLKTVFSDEVVIVRYYGALTEGVDACRAKVIPDVINDWTGKNG
jgi:hypothetical protein